MQGTNLANCIANQQVVAVSIASCLSAGGDSEEVCGRMFEAMLFNPFCALQEACNMPYST